jgi:ankyrin repeat protein
MVIRTVMIVILVLMICSTGFTAQTTDLSVETENGKKLIIKDVNSGYFESMMDYYYDKFTETNNIPLKNGYAFGFKFRLPDIPDGDAIVIDEVVKLPKPVGKGKSDIVKGKTQYDRSYPFPPRLVWTLYEDEPEYFITGKWTYSLYNKGNLLISRKFHIERSLSPRSANESSQKTLDKNNLLLAAKDGHIDIVKLLIDKGADVNAKSSNGWTALMLASETGYIDIAKLLIDKGADVNAKSSNGWTALMLASKAGHIDIVKLLIDKGVDVNTNRDIGTTALVSASGAGHIDVVKLLIDKGVDVNAKDNHIRKVIMYAYPAHPRKILKRNMGMTALMSASGAGHIDIAKLLIDKGADVNVKSNDGWTALIDASVNGHVNVVKLLIDKGVDVNANRDIGTTALVSASGAGHIDVVKLLIDKGVDVNAKSNDGWKVIMYAYPAHPRLTDGRHMDMTALMLASIAGYIDVVKLLIDKGANVNAKNNNGWTALMLVSQIAHQMSHIDLIELLIDKGADVNAKSNDGWTALKLAKKIRHSTVVQILRNAGANE